jgi:3-oxoacyl-[acyl-carrier protein] reductase
LHWPGDFPRLAAMGWCVVRNYRSDAAQAAAVVSQIRRGGGRALAIKANVGVAAEFTGLFDQGENAFGKIDAPINNACIIIPSPVKDLSDAAIDEQIDINLRGNIYGRRDAVRRLADGGGPATDGR